MPLLLLDLRPFPTEMPEFISPGEESEAIYYVLDYGDYWVETEGAIEWFVKVFEGALGEVEKKVRREENERKLRLIMGH